MHLVQILLPLADNEGNRFTREPFEAVERELMTAFGGFTAYPRAPASGLWKSPDLETLRDDMIVYEALVESLDRAWWTEYRRQLQQRFAQDVILIRATKTTLL